MKGVVRSARREIWAGLNAIPKGRIHPSGECTFRDQKLRNCDRSWFSSETMFCPPENATARWHREHADETVAAWERLIGSEDPLRCEAGVEVFQEGQEARDVFLLADGLVLLHCDLPNGGESVLGVRFPGQILEQCANGLKIPYPVSARTLVPSIIYRVSAIELRNRELQNREISVLLQRLLRIDLYNAAVFITQLKASSASDRLQGFLRLLASVLGCTPEAGAIRVPVPLRDDQLGDMLGCSHRHFKRVKKLLKQAGLLRIDGHRGFILSIR